MFKIKLETRVMLDILRKSVMNDMLGGAVLRFTEKGLITSSSFGTYGCYTEYVPAKFEEYLVDYTTDIRINQDFIKNFEEMAFQSNKICQIESDIPNNKLSIEEGTRKWKPKISNVAVETIGLADSSILLIPIEGIGYLPNTKRQPLYQAKILVEKMILPRGGNFISILPNDKTIKISWDMDGSAEDQIEIIPENISLPYVPTDRIGFTFHLSYLQNILSSLSGEIAMTIYEKSIVFNQVTADMKLTYFISTV
jgi:hypothetical protein